MKKLLTAMTLALSLNTFGAMIEDVSILSVTPKDEDQVIKFSAMTKKGETNFTVTFVKKDEMLAEKLELIKKKQELKDRYKLNLNIPSFSAFPVGSSYQSPFVNVSGAEK